MKDTLNPAIRRRMRTLKQAFSIKLAVYQKLPLTPATDALTLNTAVTCPVAGQSQPKQK